MAVRPQVPCDSTRSARGGMPDLAGRRSGRTSGRVEALPTSQGPPSFFASPCRSAAASCRDPLQPYPGPGARFRGNLQNSPARVLPPARSRNAHPASRADNRRSLSRRSTQSGFSEIEGGGRRCPPFFFFSRGGIVPHSLAYPRSSVRPIDRWMETSRSSCDRSRGNSRRGEHVRSERGFIGVLSEGRSSKRGWRMLSAQLHGEMVRHELCFSHDLRAPLPTASAKLSRAVSASRKNVQGRPSPNWHSPYFATTFGLRCFTR